MSDSQSTFFPNQFVMIVVVFMYAESEDILVFIVYTVKNCCWREKFPKFQITDPQVVFLSDNLPSVS